MDEPTTPMIDQTDPAVVSRLGPRKISVSTLILKSLAGLGTGFLGTIILLIFVFVSLSAAGGEVKGPFFAFTALVMGLIVSLVTNNFSAAAFGMVDRGKYPPMRQTLQHIAALNIIIFLFLVPVYAVASVRDTQTIFLVVALQLALAAQASAFTLELSAAKGERSNLLAVYGVTFGMLFTIIINALIYSVTGYFTTGISDVTAKSTSSGATALLFSILPLTWFFFGFFTTLTEIVYRWIYKTWGVDYLSVNKDQNV